MGRFERNFRQPRPVSSSPNKRIFLSPMQNYFGAFHRGNGGGADRNRRADAADGCCGADRLRLPGLYSRHRSEHGVGRTVRQHHLLRIRCLRRLCPCHPTRSADVLWLAQALPAEMVPLAADGGHQGRECRLPHVHELCRAVTRWTVPDLHRAGGSLILDPRGYLIAPARPARTAPLPHRR